MSLRTQGHMPRFPSPTDVQSIAATGRDPVIRNLQITEGYYRLSNALHQQTGGTGINWCTLGTWASKTAGTFIRGEEIPAAFRERLLSDGPFAEIVANDENEHLDILEIASGIAGDITVYVTEGNRVVFLELAGTVAQFLEELAPDARFDSEHLKAFNRRFKKGPPLPDAAEVDKDGDIHSTQRGGQDHLASMTSAYYEAKFETDVKRRAELLLLGNAYGGLHEQTRLQTYIQRSLDRPVRNLFLARATNRAARPGEASLLQRWLAPVAPVLADYLSDAWEDFSTAALMTLTLPDSVLHLSQPIQVQAGERYFPSALDAIERPDLKALLNGFQALHPAVELTLGDHFLRAAERIFGVNHRSDHGGLDVGATNWTELSERMTYILTLFRSRAQDQDLVEQPFSDSQVRSIENDELPTGRL